MEETIDTISLRVSDLLSLAKELSADGMDYVRLMLQPADSSDPTDVIPPCAFVSAVKRSEPDLLVDYDDLEECAEAVEIFTPRPGQVMTNL